ncbi:MAG TPA: cytochrome c [Terriglobia bacterium]|nr:cytochrome c [Terriglobia bacterium]
MNLFPQRLIRRVLGIALPVAALACLALPGKLNAQEAADLYNKKCAVCHAKDGSGNTAKGKKAKVKPVHENIAHSEADMIKIVNDGKGDDMDGYKKVYSADQIKALVDYYRSLAASSK